MDDVTIKIPRDFILDFLAALRPEGNRQTAVVGTVKDEVLKGLLASNEEIESSKLSLNTTAQTQGKTRIMTAQGRANIAAAQRKRWAAQKKKWSKK